MSLGVVDFKWNNLICALRIEKTTVMKREDMHGQIMNKKYGDQNIDESLSATDLTIQQLNKLGIPHVKYWVFGVWPSGCSACGRAGYRCVKFILSDTDADKADDYETYLETRDLLTGAMEASVLRYPIEQIKMNLKSTRDYIARGRAVYDHYIHVSGVLVEELVEKIIFRSFNDYDFRHSVFLPGLQNMDGTKKEGIQKQLRILEEHEQKTLKNHHYWLNQSIKYANLMNELNEKWGFNMPVAKVELFS